ncbi:MAG: ferric reductase-like transmembrane domain-containing protein [Chloroflexota bacterium]|nr:MAG: hypothetical protein DLM70_15865 [Chloroflexota bacterium]
MTSFAGLAAPQSATLYWYVVRGSGFVVYALLTVGVVFGLLLSLRWRSDAWPRLLTEDVHQFLQLLAGSFLSIHIVSTLLDSFVHFAWYEVLVPFSGPYRVPWMAAGIISMYFGAALALSIYVRPHVGYRTWRTLHYTGFVAWTLALVHGLATGSDTHSAWATGVYVASVVIVVGLLAVRFGGIPARVGQPPRLRPGVVAGLGVSVVVAGVLASAGPLESGWAARAGSIPGPKPSIAIPTSPLSEKVTGVAQPYNRYSLDPGYRMLTLDIDGVGRYPIKLAYRVFIRQTRVGIRFIRGLFSMTPSSGAWSCSGTVTFRPPDRFISVCNPARKETLLLVVRVSIDALGRVSGTLALSPQQKANEGSRGRNGV